jgi:hypothetical protein
MTELQPDKSTSPDLLTAESAGRHFDAAPENGWSRVSQGLWQQDAPGAGLLNGRPNDRQNVNSPRVEMVATAAVPPAAQKIFDTTEALPGELAFMQNHGAARNGAEITAIKEQLGRAAQDPEQAILGAVKNNRVLAFGDIHGPLGPHMALLAAEMPRLKQNGITDLAVEIPQAFQSHVDQWTAADQDFLRDRLKDKSSLINVIEAAKKAGIKVDCVDEMYAGDGEKLASRDRTMAKNIGGILNDPSAKVAFFAGAEHLQNGYRQDSFGPSTVDWLRQKQISVASFLQQLPSSEDSLMPIARDLRKPVSVSKADVSTIAGLKNSAGTTYDKWDNVIFYPPHYEMEGAEAELKQFGKDPKADLADALAKNRVVLLGEMSQAEPENPVSPHRNLIASDMPDLKKAGLTDLAIDLPPAYQSTLDDFSKTGTLSGPLPDSYDRDDFKAVLASAQKEGIKLHAVGLQNESISTMQQIIEGLVSSAASITRADATGQSRTMLWCREEKIANFKDDQGNTVSVASQLAAQGVSARAFAGFTQDFVEPSLGLVTQVTARPTSLEPSRTKLLREVPNSLGMQMDRFDNVIIYPSAGAAP